MTTSRTDTRRAAKRLRQLLEDVVAVCQTKALSDDAKLAKIRMLCARPAEEREGR